MKESPKEMPEYKIKYEAMMKDWQKKVKKGPNVIHLNYLDQHISPDELEELESDVEQLGLVLSSQNKSGIPINSISGLGSDLTLLLTEPGIVSVLLSGILTNGLYDGLKALIIKCWHKVKNRQTITMTARTVMERPAKFSLVIKFDELRSVELQTENLDEQSLSSAIAKISDIADRLNSGDNLLMTFDSSKLKWEFIDLTIDYLKRSDNYTRVLPLEEYLEEMKRFKPNK